MKKLFVLTALILCVSLSVHAQPIYTTADEQIVTGGVTLKNERRFFGEYALEINLITADLKDEFLGLELLKSESGVDKTASVSQLAKENENAVAVINGDFFSTYKNSQNFSLGLEIKDEKLLQSHINPDMAAGFFADGKLSFSYVDFKAELDINGEKTPIAHINKPTDYYGALLMYTPDFNGGETPFLPEGITAVTVTDNIVTGKGISMGGTLPIPENGYVLAIDDNMSPTLDHRVNLDDKLTVSVIATPSLEGVKTAFGGGTLLLKDGVKTEITHNVSGNNPRSVIGTNEDGSVIYLMTVDGRSIESRGVSLSVLSDICLEMGMVNAINLDGGGSTALVGKTLEKNALHTINSPTENRKVINAIAITSTAEGGEAEGLIAKAERHCVLSGDSVKLSYVAYDKNYNTPEKISKSVRWSVPSGRGSVKDGVYYPEKEGEVTLDLYYGNKKTDSITLYVIGSVAGITAPKSYALDFGKIISLSGVATVYDEHGNIATVNDISLLNPVYDRKLVTLNENGIQPMTEGAGLLTLSHSGAERSIVLTCGLFEADGKETIYKDSLFKNVAGGYTFDVFSAAKATTLFDRLVYARAMDVLEKADASAVVGGEKIKSLTPEKAPLFSKEYNKKDAPYSDIIVLETASGKITRSAQWEKLCEALSSNNKNTFIILDSKEAFVSDIDKEVFYAILGKAAEKKNVFVIYSGDENFAVNKDGVRYISIANSKNEKMIHKVIENTCYLSFNIADDGSATYQFKKLYK